MTMVFAGMVAVVVALLAEGVDRNFKKSFPLGSGRSSPSSRRAWIEIWKCLQTKSAACVALLAEGVDRNFVGFFYC